MIIKVGTIKVEIIKVGIGIEVDKTKTKLLKEIIDLVEIIVIIIVMGNLIIMKIETLQEDTIGITSEITNITEIIKITEAIER
jgi:hypothetical protein